MKNYRFSSLTVARLTELARLAGMSRTAMIEKLIEEAAKEVGL